MEAARSAQAGKGSYLPFSTCDRRTSKLTAVFSPGDPDPWTWEEWDSGPVAFAVWTLLDDGLRVEPFTEHADGNGVLRAAGLRGDTWRAWLLELVARHVHAQQSLIESFREHRSRALPNLADPRVQAAFRRHAAANDSLAAWPGDARTRVTLANCLDRWRAITAPPITGDLDASYELQRFERRQRLYAEFRAMRPRPPALYLHVATYPVVAMLVFPTASLVFGRPPNLSENAEEDLLRAGVRQLSTSA